jgi:DHA3 family macrolide efflux protein-like MFS transporter
MNTSKPWKKNVAFYLSSQIISLFGSMLVQSVMAWYITLETQSGLMMTIAIICGFLPTFLISPFAGVWADRRDKKKLIIFADALVATATLGLATAFLLGYKNVWLIFAAMAVRGLGQGIQQPSVNAFIPQLVPQDQLMRVNSIASSAQSAMMLLSPALAGGLMAFAPMGAIFLIDVVTAAAAITILTFFVRIDAPKTEAAAETRIGYFHDLKLGLNYVVHHKVVATLFIFNAAMMIMSGPVAMLSPLQVTLLFGADAWRLAAVDIGFSAGMLAGSVLLMSWGGFKNRHSTITLGAFVFSLGTIAFGLLGSFWLFIGMMVIVGVAMPIFSTPFTTLLQETVEPAYMGRVFSMANMLGSLAMPLGLVVFGPLGDVIGMSVLFVGTGSVLVLLSLLFALNKALRAAGRKVQPEA